MGVSNLRDLLDSSTLRRLNFIECMFENNHWWKIEKIAAQLACSESTVKSDINYFRLYFSTNFNFETSKQKGVRLIVLKSFHMDSFYQRIMRECLNVQFINLLFSETFHTLEEYAAALYTSVSSVKRSIEQVKIVLQKYNLDIQQKPIRISGSEKQILFFYGVLFWEEYGTSFLNLNYTYKKEAYEMVLEFKDKMNISLSVTLINKMTIWLVLYFERFSQGHHVEKGYTTLIPVSKELEDFVFEYTLNLPFAVTAEDIKFASYFFESRYLYFKEEAIATNPELLKVYNEIAVFLKTLSNKTSIHLANQKNLQKRLFSQFVYRYEFTGLNYPLVDRNKIAVLNNEEIYACFLVTVQEILHSSDKSKWVSAVLADFNDFFYILISTWENLTTEIFKQRMKINTLIISQFGLYHEKFLQELSNLRFPYTLNIFLLTEENFSEIEIDLIITDHEVQEIKFQLDKDIPVIGVNYSPNTRNWNHIKEMIEVIYLQKQLGTKK